MAVSPLESIEPLARTHTGTKEFLIRDKLLKTRGIAVKYSKSVKKTLSGGAESRYFPIR